MGGERPPWHQPGDQGSEDVNGGTERIVRATSRPVVRIVKESMPPPERRHPEGCAAGGDRRVIPFNQETDR